jgi:hypothetical protein
MDTRGLECLLEAGVPFSITIGKSGRFVVKLGHYLREASSTTEAATMEDAVNWLLAHVSPEQRRGYSVGPACFRDKTTLRQEAGRLLSPLMESRSPSRMRFRRTERRGPCGFTTKVS